MDSPVRYADCGGIQIAYQVLGSGPLHLVFAFDWASNVELIREIPSAELLLRRLASFSRLILFDPRGMGLSDPLVEPPSPEQWIDDVRAVMDAAGAERATLVGHGHGGQLGMLFAASHPERTTALVTVNAYARLARADDYPWGMPEQLQRRVLAAIEERWGSGFVLEHLVPGSPDDTPTMRRWAAIERTGGSPRRAAAKQKMVFAMDIRHLLHRIATPTLVIQNAGNDLVRPGHGRYLAKHIPGATYLELPGRGHWPWSSDADRFTVAIEEFVTGARGPGPSQRQLATVAFTDIVDSTRVAAALGDRRWRELLEVHDAVARRAVEQADGRVVKSTGDGLLAVFLSPARALAALQDITRSLDDVGLRVRAGAHTGEIELRGDDIGGLAVHIAARVAARAAAGEVLASSTVKDLVTGSGLRFTDRGTHDLKGVPEPWRLFAVARGPS